MDANEIKEIDILILDGDAFFNDLLARKLHDLGDRPDIRRRVSLNVEQYHRPGEFLDRAVSKQNGPVPSMAFVDIFPGEGLDGQHLGKILRRQNEFMNVVFMSRPGSETGDSSGQYNPASFPTRILKHEYTPDICCILVENYINNL